MVELHIVPIVLFAVSTVVPDLADISGGTKIQISGEGFSERAVLPVCRFFDGITKSTIDVTGNWISNSSSGTVIECVSPPTPYNIGLRCEGQTIDVQLTLGGIPRASDNKLLLKRVQLPLIRSVTPDYGYYRSNNTIIVEGERFAPSSYARCRWTSGDGQVIYSRPADILSTQRAACVQPALSDGLLGPSSVSLSLDGSRFSDFPLKYEVVTDAFGLIAEIPDAIEESSFHNSLIESINSTFTVKNSNQTDVFMFSTSRSCLADLQIYVIDKFHHKVLSTEGSTMRTVSLRILGNLTFALVENVGNSTSSVNKGQSTILNTTKDGEVEFTNLCFVKPLQGVSVLQMTIAPWPPVEMQLHIIPGAVNSIRIAVPPSSTSRQGLTSVDTLAQQPLLKLVDISGNDIDRDTITNVEVRGHFIPQDFGGRTRPSSNLVVHSVQYVYGKGFDFDNNKFSLEGRRGGQYRLTFTATDGGVVFATNVVSGYIKIPECVEGEQTDHYFYNGSLLCNPCPVGGVCNGSSIVYSSKGYWIGPSSSKPELCPSKDQCVGGKEQCRFGSGGALCARCDKGYAGSSCNKCAAKSILTVQLVLIVLAIAIVIAGILAMNLRKKSRVKDPLPIGFKMLMNHLQVSSKLGQLNIILPSLLIAMFSIQSAASDVSLSYDVYYCLFEGFTVYLEFWLYVCFPLLITPLLGLVPFVMWLSRKWSARRDVVRSEVEAHVEAYEHKVDQVPLVNKKTYTRVFIVALVIVVYFTYPTIVNACGRLLQCQRIVVGQTFEIKPGGTEVITNIYGKFLVSKPTVDCNSGEYLAYNKIASLMLAIYGIVVPIGVVLLIMIARKRFGREDADFMFLFLVSGFRESRWYWESINIFKKFMIVCIRVFIVDANLQIWTGMWALSFMLGFQYLMDPYDNHFYNMVECISGAVLVVTLNLMLLYPFFIDVAQRSIYQDYTSLSSGSVPLFYLLTAIILLLHLVAVLMFVLMMLYGVRLKIGKLLRLKETKEQLADDIEWMGIKEATRMFRKKHELDNVYERSASSSDHDPASRRVLTREEITAATEEVTNHMAERQDVLLLQSVSGMSLTDVYEYYCLQNHFPPREQMKSYLDSIEDGFEMTSFTPPPNLPWSTLTTIPLMQTLSHCHDLQSVSFAHCELTAAALSSIIQMAPAHRSLRKVNLTHNSHMREDFLDKISLLAQGHTVEFIHDMAHPPAREQCNGDSDSNGSFFGRPSIWRTPSAGSGGLEGFDVLSE